MLLGTGCASYGLEMTTLASYEKYSKRDNSWSLIAPMPLPRSRINPALVGDAIFVAGGQVQDRGGEQRPLLLLLHSDTFVALSGVE